MYWLLSFMKGHFFTINSATSVQNCFFGFGWCAYMVVTWRTKQFQTSGVSILGFSSSVGASMQFCTDDLQWSGLMNFHFIFEDADDAIERVSSDNWEGFNGLNGVGGLRGEVSSNERGLYGASFCPCTFSSGFAFPAFSWKIGLSGKCFYCS